MRIKVLFNSNGLNEEFSIGWGVSFLIGEDVLFDAGEKGEGLLNNMTRMGVDVGLIKNIVISHDHWDHTGGLWDILRQRQDMRVFACPGFSAEFKQKVRLTGNHLIEQEGFAQISGNVYTTGEIFGEYKGEDISEQALVVDTRKGLTVITGCAHPGIVVVMDRVREQFSGKLFYAVLGGFHLMNKHPRNMHAILNMFKDFGVQRAGPTHCSGVETEEVFKKKYGKNFITMKVGEVVDI